MLHANGWIYQRRNKLYRQANETLYDTFCENENDILYIACGPYADYEHFRVPFKKIFKVGLKGIYAEAEEALTKCATEKERDFVVSAMRGISSLHKIAEKFADLAEQQLQTETDPDHIKNLELIAKTARRVPWNRPESVYEGLCTYAFMRKALGSIEGVGFNSIGRVDVQLYPLYLSDRSSGISDEEIYDNICKFLLIWDAHVDRTVVMTGYADYEYENSLQLGGCDENGAEVFNRITEMILNAHYELDNMFPKIKCRFSSKSSDAYLSLITKPILSQKSILLYCNDDAFIPAMVKNGYPLEIARDYAASGCWGIAFDDYCKDACGYVNTLRAVEWGMYMPEDRLKANGLHFRGLAECKSFEEIYDCVLHNILDIIRLDALAKSEGCRIWQDVSPVCAYSALLMDPLQNRKDYSAGGSRFNWEQLNLAALPDTIDSLLAIKYLCFDKKVCTISELIAACKDNWSDESLRQMAIHAHAHGDGSEESARMLEKIIDDIYNNTRELPTSFGGKWQISAYMYTEIIWWGKQMAATPNGRRSGDYLSQGLTPSRLHAIKSTTDVFSSLRYYDYKKLACGSVINVVLPAAKMNADIINAFLRACAESKAHILQLNCVNREDLLKAKKEPEKYKYIIVRVCGFSAPFVSLSEEYQNEFLSRNFYEN